MEYLYGDIGRYRNNMFPDYVANHLKKVYSTLTLFFLMFTGAILWGLNSGISHHSLIIYSFVGSITSMLMLYTNIVHKLISTILTSIFLGLTMVPVLDTLILIDHNIVLIAGLTTFAIFASMTIVSYFMPFKSLFYIGSLLFSGLSVLLVVGILNLFVMSETIHSIELYGGLVLFVIYIVYDSQLMIERAYKRGSTVSEFAHIFDAFNLFLDATNIFIRLLEIIGKLKSKSKRKYY
jgi:FtsH-binding integral membrane protein